MVAAAPIAGAMAVSMRKRATSGGAISATA